MARMARPSRRHVRSVWRFFRAEQRTLRQGLAALLLSTGAGLVAGIVLGSISDTPTLLPSLFMLLPGVDPPTSPSRSILMPLRSRLPRKEGAIRRGPREPPRNRERARTVR